MTTKTKKTTRYFVSLSSRGVSSMQLYRHSRLPSSQIIISLKKKKDDSDDERKEEKRSKRIRRHVISLPSHANRFDNDDTITNVKDGSAKCNDYICKFVHLLSTLCYFCSLPIVMMEIYNFRIAPILGFGLFLFKILVFDLFLSIMGKIRYWPKTEDLCAATVFGISAIFRFAYPDTPFQFRSMFGIHIFTFGSLTLFIAITWFLLFLFLAAVFILIRILRKLLQNITKKSTYG